MPVASTKESLLVHLEFYKPFVIISSIVMGKNELFSNERNHKELN